MRGLIVACVLLLAGLQSGVSRGGPQVDTRQPIRVHPLFPPSPYSVGFIDPDKRDRFNLGLQRLRESGRYQSIEAQYADF